MPAGASVGLKITSATASSRSTSSRAAKFAIDGDPTTAWKAEPYNGTDEWLEINIQPAAVTRIELWAGWQASSALYYGNRRPHNVRLDFWAGDTLLLSAGPVPLVETLGKQTIQGKDNQPMNIVGVTRIRLTVLDWYNAKKTSAVGSPTTEVAISDIRVYGVPMP